MKQCIFWLSILLCFPLLLCSQHNLRTYYDYNGSYWRQKAIASPDNGFFLAANLTIGGHENIAVRKLDVLGNTQFVAPLLLPFDSYLTDIAYSEQDTALYILYDRNLAGSIVRLGLSPFSGFGTIQSIEDSLFDMRISSGPSIASSMTISQDNKLLIFTTLSDSSSGLSRSLLIKYDIQAGGQVQKVWTQFYDIAGQDCYAKKVIELSSGNYLLFGATRFAGPPRYSYTPTHHSLRQCGHCTLGSSL